MNFEKITLPNSTASQAIVTNSTKDLVSLQYTNANTASTLVQRDASGNFSAGTITATLSGAATSANTVSSANEATDTTCFPLFITASGTQTLQTKNNTSLTFDSSNATLGSSMLSLSVAPTSTAIPLTFSSGAGGTYISWSGNRLGIVSGGNFFVGRNVAYDTTGGFTFIAGAGAGTATLTQISNSAYTVGVATGGTAGGAATFTTYLTVNTSGISSTGANFSGLTATQAVVTDSSKNLASVSYTNANISNSIVQRDASGNFSAGTITANLTGTASTATAANTVSSSNEATDTTCFPLFITASGTQTLEPKNNTNLTFNSNTAAFGATGTATFGNLLINNISGNATSAVTGQVQFNSSGSPTAGNLYGIAIQKNGVDLFMLGINKNTISGAVPASACYISTYSSASKLSIGRGDGAGALSTTDILLNGDGTLSFCNSYTPSGVTSAINLPNSLGDASYINFGGNGRNIGVFNLGTFFFTFNANYNTTSNAYTYDQTSTATAIEIGSTSVKLRAAASGTAGNTVTFQDVLTATVSGLTVTGNTSGVSVDATASASGIINQISIANTSNTGSSGASFIAKTAGASSGDAYYNVQNVGTGQNYTFGLDNSVSGDPFVIACSGTLGTTNAISIDSSANVTVVNDFATVAGYPAYQCRAWVNFNGTGTIAIRASGNVTSITDGGTGTYTVNLTTAMPDANFSAHIQFQSNSGNQITYIDGAIAGASVLTTSTIPIRIEGTGGTRSDSSVVCCSIFR